MLEEECDLNWIFYYLEKPVDKSKHIEAVMYYMRSSIGCMARRKMLTMPKKQVTSILGKFVEGEKK